MSKRTTEAIGNAFIGSFARWFEAFQEWVEVLTGQDLDARHRIVTSRWS
jgi:hypothetical protein